MGENVRAATPAGPGEKPLGIRVPAFMALGSLPPTLDRIEAKIDEILSAPGVGEPAHAKTGDRGASVRGALRSAARTANRMADAASFEILVQPEGRPKSRRRTRRWPGIVMLAVALTPLSLALHIALWIALY